MPQSIKDRIKKMMVERLFLNIDPREIAEDKSLIDHYGVDSLNLLELVVGIEEEFGVAIDDNEFRVKNFETVNALADFVKSKMG
ncbi:MAG: acyl carrier protein [Candidatus Pacebacteria bacterium]|nr:acyl carrier protein [Candidatus Paceibacterota bacterium]